MKKGFRILGILVAVVVLVAAGGVAFLMLRFPRHRPLTALSIDPTPERVARGRYIVEHVSDCFGCHSDHDFDRFGIPVKAGTEGQGGFVFDEKLGVPGIVAAHNITPDPATGIGSWTDDEVVRAIREGVSRDGRPLFPMMPYEDFRHMSDEDVYSVVAYLRSLHPVRNTVAATRIKFPVNLIMRTIPSPLSAPVTAPSDEQDHLGYGRYLVTIAGCGGCHTPHDDKGAPILSESFSGGWEMHGPWGRVVTANITPASNTFVGTATKEEFIARFKGFASMNPRRSGGRSRTEHGDAVARIVRDDREGSRRDLRLSPHASAGGEGSRDISGCHGLELRTEGCSPRRRGEPRSVSSACRGDQFP